MSVRFQADNDLRFGIVKAVRRREPAIDLRSAQEARLSHIPDPELLDRAWAENRVLISHRVVVTHDLSTMVPALHSLLRSAPRCAPIVFVPDSLPVSAAIDDLLLLDECATEADWSAGVLYLPLSQRIRHYFIGIGLPTKRNRPGTSGPAARKARACPQPEGRP